ncbi:MAG: GNAT family N-acetyltransferase [Actinomycetota bacterium]
MEDRVRIDLPPGHTARPGSPEDVATVLALVAAAERHLDGVVEVDGDDVESDFARVGFDPATDCLIVLDGAEPVGWADVHRERAEADVRPSHYGRGIGTALLRWTEGRARELGFATVGQTITDHNVGGSTLFRANGYEPVWTSWILEIAFDGPPPRHLPPEGITLRSYDPARDARIAHRLLDDAFSEWEGRSAEPFEEWEASVVQHKAFSHQLSRLAFDGDRLVGAALALDYAADREGWVQQLATTATHRHRGIARALLSSVFDGFAERGKHRVGLSTDSRTGALGLYERVGMTVRRSYTRYGKRLV